MKLSQSSLNTYLFCQRKYWFRKEKVSPDIGWVKHPSLKFGAVFAKLQELIMQKPANMTLSLIAGVCKENELDDKHVSQMAACLRKYMSHIPEGELCERVEIQLEHDVLSGRIDKLVTRKGKRYIVEDKTTSEINAAALSNMLLTDPQLCVYAVCREQFEADAILYRAVQKPKERIKKSETFLEYNQRCKCEFIEIPFEFEQLRTEECLARFKVCIAEIEWKTTEDEYMQNYKNCKAFGSYCEYYGRCNECAS